MEHIYNKKQHKRLGNALFKLTLITIFGLFLTISNAWAQFATVTHIISDTSPTTIAQVQQTTQQTVLQSAIMKSGIESKIQDYLHYSKEVQQWIDVINKYSTMIEQNVKRFTSLRGILSVAEQQLELSDDTLKALADLGTAIRATISLKQQFIGMVRSRLAMIENLERRARSGIFNPEADLQDLEEYLTASMGRQAQARLKTRAKLAEQDPELERLTNELETIRANRTAAEKDRDEINTKLGKETSMNSRPRTVTVGEDGATAPNADPNGRVSLSIDATNTMILRLGQLDQLIADLKKQEAELIEKISKRYQARQGLYDEVYFTGEQWKEATDGWLKFSEEKNAKLGSIVDTYGNTDLTDRPRVAPTP